MTAYNTKGTKIRLIKGSATPSNLIPTAISQVAAGDPIEIAVADVTGVVIGQVVKITGTTYPELDDKVFVVSDVDGVGNTFDILNNNIDLSASTGNLAGATTPIAAYYLAADEVALCLSSIDIAAPSTNTIDTSTFCADSQLAGRATPGTITMEGYADKSDAGVLELIKADDDAENRIFKLELSNDQGYLVGEIAFAGFGFTVPLEGAYGYTITGTQASRIMWIH